MSNVAEAMNADTCSLVVADRESGELIVDTAFGLSEGIIRGERATLEIEQLGNGVTLRVGSRALAVSGSAGAQTIADLFDRQLQAFRRAIYRDGGKDADSGVDLPEGQAGRQVVALIEQAYRQRQSHRESWES